MGCATTGGSLNREAAEQRGGFPHRGGQSRRHDEQLVQPVMPPGGMLPRLPEMGTCRAQQP